MPPTSRRGSWEEYIVQVYPRLDAGGWINYVLGSFLLLQHLHPKADIRGVDGVIYGNIVLAAGLSSSSALSCAGTIAAAHASGINLNPEQVVLTSGRAEWFSGSRGGAGDHAAIMLTPMGKIIHDRTQPKLNYRFVDFPSAGELVAAFSEVRAVKTIGQTKDLYNRHSTSYEFAVRLLRRRVPKLSALTCLGSLLDPQCGLSEKEILEAIAVLPERISREVLRQELTNDTAWFERAVSTHSEPGGGYALRKIALFGVAEFSRSRLLPVLAAQQDLGEIGRLMYVSHDGDRAVHFLPSGESVSNRYETTDAYLLHLINQASGAPDDFHVLPYIPGDYGNGCAETDHLVDLCKPLDFVYGASLTGAGFGGHVLMLVRRGEAEKLFSVLRREYYEKRGHEFMAYLCHPVRGATFHPLV